MTERIASLIDLRAERLVLCGLLKEPELCMPAVRSAGLVADDFGWWAHRCCFGALMALWSDGFELGPDSLYLRLKRDGTLAELGANPGLWLADLWFEDPTGAWCHGAALRAMEMARRRAKAHAAVIELRDLLMPVAAEQEDVSE